MAKLRATLLITIAANVAAINAYGRHHETNSRPTFAHENPPNVEVYLVDGEGLSAKTAGTGTQLASRIFKQAGISVRWHEGEPPAHLAVNGITIRIGTAPRTVGRRALATAVPQLRQINVYFDRIRATQDYRPTLAYTLFGFVLAHEIAHVLQGEPRHSGTGILKSDWSPNDYADMVTGRLVFTAQDLELMWEGPMLAPANAS